MEQIVTFKDRNGVSFRGILSAPTPNLEKIVIMVHGFTSNKNTKSQVMLSSLLTKEGIHSLRFDLFAHGESEGKFEDLTTSKAVSSILSAIDFVKKKGYKKIALIGSSFGGISSMMAATKTHDLTMLGLKSPVSDYDEVWTRRRTPEEISKWRETGYTDYEDDGTVHKLKYDFFDDFKNNKPYEVAHLITIPTIIVHGDSDTVVPVGQSRKISKLIPNCRLVLIKGADHWYRGPGEMNKLVKAFRDFIVDHLK